MIKQDREKEKGTSQFQKDESVGKVKKCTCGNKCMLKKKNEKNNMEWNMIRNKKIYVKKIQAWNRRVSDGGN